MDVQSGDSLAFKLTILDLQGHGNGKWEMTARADLVQGAKLMDSQTFSRDTTLLNAFHGGSCYLVERMAVQLGRDMAAWLSKSAPSGPQAEPSSEADAPEQPPAKAAPEQPAQLRMP